MIDLEDDASSAVQANVDEKPIKDWRSKFENSTLTPNDLIKFFQNAAPNYFELESSADNVRCTYNESAAKYGIIDVLEEFICGDNPQVILEKIKLEGNVPSVCGRVFKNGEPTYSCRECGMDPTCVLCVNCFKLSAHRYHKYRMSTSGGGGCCDCGDEEAWKKDPYCEEHMRGKEIKPESSVITSRMKERCEIAFQAIIMYSIKFLEVEVIASLESLEDGDRDDDLFCTILYNDESHTFEQVIQTLIKIVKIPQKEAMEIVTSIDREGRAIIRCDSFETCFNLKENIEKLPMRHTNNTSKLSPLKVSVLHKRAVSCQQFALQLLTWFQEFLSRHATFRQIFAQVANDKRRPNYNIGHILEYDWKLWKTARSCWHRLLICGMLMEYENKKMLAIEFSKHYATIIQDFIRDDHDHSISIVSLSVQLFTVPTLAHYLIANEDTFHKLLHVFYSETITKYVQNGILHFAKNATNMNVFKRSSYILSDIKYILSFKPDVWTVELREGFVEGVKVLMKLLSVMQGMDAVYRQTGQHMDYEPEWESAFNLHIKISFIISLVLEWCSTDREVLVKVYKMVMTYLMDNEFVVGRRPGTDSRSGGDSNAHIMVMEEKTYAGHVANCIIYDVASKLVSIHLPLSRFFAGIYLHLGKFGLNFDNATTVRKRTPEEIIEPILCTVTMTAQVHAGMWRRNGYALLHQLFFYRNVRCRSEMIDRDICGLQIGAALIESNQFLIHILNKFDLLEWADPNYENNVKQIQEDDHIRQLNMIDEFLELLIVIIGERYIPGIGCVTEEDRAKKEIIQQLCIKNFSHSELNRALPDTNNVTVLEDVIDSIAVFKKPSKSDSKGVYELKEEFYEDYNMFFYHYTKEEKSKSEETQRLRRKNKGLLVCCPPPKLPKLTDGFVSIANLLQSDVMLSLMQVVLSRALDLRAKSFTDSHLQKILHLIGYALQEEESGNYPFLTFCERALKFEILPLLEKLTHSVRVETHRDFIIWTVKKFKEVQVKQNEDGNNETMESDDTNQPMTAAEAERQEKEERAKLAAARRAKIMAQMQNAQKNFMKSNAELFENTSTESATMDWQNFSDDEDGELASAVINPNINCLGLKRKLPQADEQKFKCILCFEDCIVSKEGHVVVYSAFIQKSRVLFQPGDDNPPAPHTSTCGHVMHSSCWQEYYENELHKESRRPNRQRSPSNFLIEKKEFLCPYCRCLSNAIIPLTPPLAQFEFPLIFEDDTNILSFDTWINIMRRYLEEVYAVEQSNDLCFEWDDYKMKFPDIDTVVKEFVEENEFKKLFQLIRKNEVTNEWKDFTETFIESVKRVVPYPHSAEDSEPFLIAWNSCHYTIQSLEMYLRATDKPFKNEMSIRHTSCLTGLVRVSGMLGMMTDLNIADKLLIHLRGTLETVFKQKGPSVLEWDVFPMLSSLIFIVPSIMYVHKDLHIVPSGNYMEYYFLTLMFMANIAKAVILYRTNENETPYMEVDTLDDEDTRIFLTTTVEPQHQQSGTTESSDANMEEEKTVTASTSTEATAVPSTSTTSMTQRDKRLASIIQFYKKYNLQLKEEASDAEVCPRTIRRLIQHIKQESKTFLRCSCLLFHFLTDVEFPDQFASPNGDTFETMCKYLGLNPDVEYYFDVDEPYLSAIELFGSHPDILHYDAKTKSKPNGGHFTIVPCVAPVRQLITLPDDYSDLINDVSDYTCPNNDREESRNPTMCLICGEVLCGQSYCCQPFLDKLTVGACTYHVHHCGADIGIFLRIRECQVMYLGMNKGCSISPPYLDEYGETDPGLRRGNPLRLCHEHYRKINLTWLGHGLHEEIAHLNESLGQSVIATVWQHM